MINKHTNDCRSDSFLQLNFGKLESHFGKVRWKVGWIQNVSIIIILTKTRYICPFVTSVWFYHLFFNQEANGSSNSDECHDHMSCKEENITSENSNIECFGYRSCEDAILTMATINLLWWIIFMLSIKYNDKWYQQ